MTKKLCEKTTNQKFSCCVVLVVGDIYNNNAEDR